MDQGHSLVAFEAKQAELIEFSRLDVAVGFVLRSAGLIGAVGRRWTNGRSLQLTLLIC